MNDGLNRDIACETADIVIDSNHFLLQVSDALTQKLGYQSPEEMILIVGRLESLCVDTRNAMALLQNDDLDHSLEPTPIEVWTRKGDRCTIALRLKSLSPVNVNQATRTNSREAEDLQGQDWMDLQTANNWLKSILESNTDYAIIITDTEGIIREFSVGAQNLTGFSIEDVIGKTPFEILHVEEEIEPQKREHSERLGRQISYIEMFTSVPVQQGSETSTWTFKRKDGSRFPATLTISPIKGINGDMIGYLGIARNVSDKATIEKSLLESEALLRGINANMPGVAFKFYSTQDGQQGISYISDRIESLFGLNLELGDVFQQFLRCLPEEDREYFLETIRDSVINKTRWDYEGRFIKPSGEMIWFQITSLPRVLEDRIDFDGLLLDITSKKQVEEALSKRLVALTQPLEEPQDISFEDLFNLDDIQQLQDEFAEATGVASIITYPDGTPITKPSNFCRLCAGIIRNTEKGRLNCYHSDAVIGKRNLKGPTVQQCMSGGLWDAGAGISVGGRHIANWLIGQVRDETQTVDKIREYAHKIGADEEDMVAAFNEVPAMSKERFQKISRVLFTLANQLSTSAYQNIQQARFITDREKAEERLRQSEDKYTKIFMTAPDGIITFRLANGTINDANQGFVDLTGWPHADMQGKSFESLELFSDTHELEYILDHLKLGQDILRREFSFKKRDGVERTGIYSARPISILGNASCLFVLQDISELRSYEEERRQLEQQLFQSQKMDAIGQLAGGIAHDFNNILLAVSGNAKLAAIDTPDDNPITDNLKEIIKGCDRASDLVRQILLFSRPQSLNAQVISLPQIVQDVLKLVRATIPAMIQIRTDVTGKVPSIVADASQIHQIVINIATNAAQAIGQSNGTIAFTIDSERVSEGMLGLEEGRYVRLAISDDGCGIDPIIIGRIFDPFFSTKAVGMGSGLGLSVVHGIMKSLGGAISVESELGKGSTFTLYFPAVGQATADISDREMTQPSPECKGKHILYVDDDSALVLLIERMFGKRGYEVMGMEDPSEALKRFKADPHSFDAVVTDLSMPVMSGFDFAREILAIRPDVPVFMTTGYVRAEDSEVAARIGVRKIIIKPNTLEELMQTLDQLFSEAEIQSRASSEKQ